MGKAKASGKKAIINAITDPSLEFDVLEMARQRLVKVFSDGGHERLEAEKIALYVVEGLRHVPNLLNVLTRVKAPSQDEILDALGPVLDEAVALDKAKLMLLRVDEDDEEMRKD